MEFNQQQRSFNSSNVFIESRLQPLQTSPCAALCHPLQAEQNGSYSPHDETPGTGDWHCDTKYHTPVTPVAATRPTNNSSERQVGMKAASTGRPEINERSSTFHIHLVRRRHNRTTASKDVRVHQSSPAHPILAARSALPLLPAPALSLSVRRRFRIEAATMIERRSRSKSITPMF